MTMSITHSAERASPMHGLLPLWVGVFVYAMVVLAGEALTAAALGAVRAAVPGAGACRPGGRSPLVGCVTGVVDDARRGVGVGRHHAASKHFHAHMILVEVGAKVTVGQPLLVLEAMKMEQTVAAPAAGVVAELRAKAGEQVAAGQVLAVVDNQ